MKIILIRRRIDQRPKSLSWWMERILMLIGLSSLALWGSIQFASYFYQKKEIAYVARNMDARSNRPHANQAFML